MNAYDLIDAKKRGRTHTADEIRELVHAITDGSMPDYQVSAWLMAVWFRGLEAEETYELTMAMRDSGDTLDLSRLSGPTADKHSTGGVGDKISLILAPLAAELGLQVPMLSGRGLGHTGGTLDKLAAIEGYRVDLEPESMVEVVEKVGCSIVGQTDRIAPADRRLYALRDVTATVDCVPLIVSSILSKKLAAAPQNLVFDLKCGSGAFMRTPEAARELAAGLVRVGSRAGKNVSALITDMDQPLGEAVGHAHEVLESLDVMKGGGPAVTRDLTVALTVEMAVLAGLGTADELLRRAETALDDGSALQRFLRMVEAHGGRLDPENPAVEVAPEVEPLTADRDGVLSAVATEQVGWAVVDLGGGRRKHDDRLDTSVGLRVRARIGDRVEQGQTLCEIFAHDADRAKAARKRLRRAFAVGDDSMPAPPLVAERVTLDDVRDVE